MFSVLLVVQFCSCLIFSILGADLLMSLVVCGFRFYLGLFLVELLSLFHLVVSGIDGD